MESWWYGKLPLQNSEDLWPGVEDHKRTLNRGNFPLRVRSMKYVGHQNIAMITTIKHSVISVTFKPTFCHNKLDLGERRAKGSIDSNSLIDLGLCKCGKEIFQICLGLNCLHNFGIDKHAAFVSVEDG